MGPVAGCQSRPYAQAIAALLLTQLHAITNAADTLLWSNGWEPGSGNNPYPSVLADSSCVPGCPSASHSVTAAAAHTGSLGLQLRIDKTANPIDQGWRVQVSTPVFSLLASQSVTLCLWIKSNVPMWGNNTITLNMQQAQTYAWVSDQVISTSTDWQQWCMALTQPPQATPGSHLNASVSGYYWALALGGAPAGTVFYMDDFTLTARPNNLDPAVMAAAATRINTMRKGNFTVRFQTTPGMAIPASSMTSLSLTLKSHGFPFGTEIDTDSNNTDPATLAWFQSTTATLFNSMVPGNKLKWPEYEPVQGDFQAMRDLLLGPDYLGFAARSNMVFKRGHTLEWLIDQFNFAAHWSRQHGCQLYKGYLQTRIMRDMVIFKGLFASMDVLNEILHERAWADECNLFNGTIQDMFRWAHSADPSSLLCLNEYGLIEGEQWANLVALVQSWQSQGVPVQCIGVQAHITPDLDPSLVKFRLDQLASLGLPLYITEMDFSSYWDPKTHTPVYNGTEQQQAAAYTKFLTLFFSHPAVNGVLLWGWWDSSHWVRKGGIVRADRTWKPAATAIQQLWSQTWNSSVSLADGSLTANADGSVSFRGFHGTYTYQMRLAGSTQLLSGTLSFPMPAPSANATPDVQALVVPVPVQAGPPPANRG